MNDLDERDEGIDAILRASGPRLRAAMSRVPVSDFRGPRSAHRRKWLIALATVVVLIVGLVAIGTNRNDRSLGNDPGRFQWLVTKVPDKLTLVALADPLSQPVGTDVVKAMVNVYATDATPFGPVLSVRGSNGLPDLDIAPSSEGGTNFKETTIDGRRAAFADGQPGQRLLYIETGGHWVGLLSRNIDDARLQQMAQAAVRNVDGTATIPTASLADGLKLVLRADTPLIDQISGSAFGRVDYASPDGRSVDLAVSVPTDAARAMLALEASFVPTKVKGVEGLSASYSVELSAPPIEVHIVSWERNGLLFRVTGKNVTEAETRAAAESVEPTSDTKWNELLKQTGYAPGSNTAAPGTVPAEPAQPADTVPPFGGDVHDVKLDVSVTDPSPNDQIWSGTLPTGETWKVDVTRVFDSISMRPQINGLAQGLSSGSVVRPAGQEFACCGPLNVVTADRTATAMRVTTNHGDRFTIPLHDLPGTGGLRVALIALADGGGPKLAELIDADSNVLETM
jgi:hypothetical protein